MIVFLPTINSQESEKMLRRCIKQLPSHVDAIFSLARLLSNTTSSGVQVQYGYSSGYRLEEVKMLFVFVVVVVYVIFFKSVKTNLLQWLYFVS